ncbi:hypothetical protein HOC35_01565 [Candidatus Woesearchaeota archaeon]|nr:hypothetical protein [Candidatus Woesearchaeota archaeon]
MRKKIHILDGYEEIKDKQGIAVIIDVFRASNTILSIFEAGAQEVITKTAKTAAEVDKLREEYPKHTFFGEHMGKKFENTDYDNSPSTAYRLENKINEAVVISTMGTSAIEAANNAYEIIIASFGNIDAVVEYLKPKETDIYLVACGDIGKTAIEDYVCAQSIANMLLGLNVDEDYGISIVAKNSSGVGRLVGNGMYGDLEQCLTTNYSELVPCAEIDCQGFKGELMVNRGNI